MKKILILVLALVLLASCVVIEEVEEETPVKEPVKKVVEPPKEEAPVKEVEKVVTVKKAEPAAYIAENLDIPTEYWYYNTDTGFGATVSGDKRASMWDEVSQRHILCYWSPDSPDIYILFGEISSFGLEQVRNITEPVRRDYIAYVRKEISMDSYPEGPVDWMIRFKDAIPTRVETNEEVLLVENRYITSDLRLHYSSDGEGYILRFDKHNKVPVVVERTRNGIVVERKKYYYDIQEYDLFTLRNVEITPERVAMPEQMVLLTEEEAKEYEAEGYWRYPDHYNPLIVIDQVINVFEGTYIN